MMVDLLIHTLAARLSFLTLVQEREFMTFQADDPFIIIGHHVAITL
jgi:hypothetical protein